MTLSVPAFFISTHVLAGMNPVPPACRYRVPVLPNERERFLFRYTQFILPKVLVCLKFVSGSHVLRSHNKLLRTIVLGADLQDEVAWGRLPPNPPLTLIFLKQKWYSTKPIAALP